MGAGRQVYLRQPFASTALMCGDIQHSGTPSRPLTIAGALRGHSFEETVEILKEDGCLEVAENVAFSQTTPIGTSAFELALDRYVNVYSFLAVISERMS